ncbi:MAG: hypothetical protein AAFW01_17845 [Pseudomonadota bacterium]
MKLFGGIFGSAGHQQAQSSLFTRSVDGFATMAALAATVFVVPVAWVMVEDWAARELLDLYGEPMAVVMFWALKLGAYPLTFYAIRMSLATTYATLAIGIAMRFL